MMYTKIKQRKKSSFVFRKKSSPLYTSYMHIISCVRSYKPYHLDTSRLLATSICWQHAVWRNLLTGNSWRVSSDWSQNLINSAKFTDYSSFSLSERLTKLLFLNWGYKVIEQVIKITEFANDLFVAWLGIVGTICLLSSLEREGKKAHMWNGPAGHMIYTIHGIIAANF